MGFVVISHRPRVSARPTVAARFVAPIAALLVCGLVSPPAAQAGGMTCRKVVAGEASGESSNALKASRARCRSDEFLTGGLCYPEVRPDPDGGCQTSAMGIIQTLAESPNTTQGAFYTCLQTGGTECAIEERTRAMAICCKYLADDADDAEQ